MHAPRIISPGYNDNRPVMPPDVIIFDDVRQKNHQIYKISAQKTGPTALLFIFNLFYYKYTLMLCYLFDFCNRRARSVRQIFKVLFQVAFFICARRKRFNIRTTIWTFRRRDIYCCFTIRTCTRGHSLFVAHFTNNPHNQEHRKHSYQETDN